MFASDNLGGITSASCPVLGQGVFILWGELTNYDIIIIGAGPAGSTLARLLNEKYKVALIDYTPAKKLEGKTCGGLLAPDAQKCLAHFGLTLPNDVLTSPQTFAVKTVDVGYDLTRYYQRSYLNMNRSAFDSWLKGLVPHRVDIISCRCDRLERTADGFSVELSTGECLSSKYLVGADGGNSVVRSTLYPDKPIRSYIALQYWTQASASNSDYSCYFDRRKTDCYMWSLQKDDRFIIGGAFPSKTKADKTLAGYFSDISGVDLTKSKYLEGCKVSRPKSVREIFCGDNNAFLVGEAGGFISPSSLEGISWAMNTAEALALSFDTDNPNRAYQKAVKPYKFKLWLKLLKCPFMYFPPLRNLVMASRIKSISLLNRKDLKK